MKTHSPVFISKKELGRWYPSISFSLRNTDCILIDRSNPSAAVAQIGQFGAMLNEKRIAGCIFPEGTRAREGVIKHFKLKGLVAMLENAPDALLVPIAISNSWKLVSHGLFPVPWGTTVRLHILAPINRSGKSSSTLAKESEAIIREALTKTV